ncbi:MAG TPA: protein kinase, partial [Thermoanaerobaculia bacterium]|nr:protein kinase [Thermoanaerobaculia bacterium]
HPHICALYDVGNAGGVEYLVMELLEGQILSDRLSRGPLPREQVLEYGKQIAEALDAAHRRSLVHRDLKPGNVMITRSGVKLLDFGLAKTIGTRTDEADVTSLPTEADRPLTERGTILGTFQYMAPEQLEGKPADARTDIFALGCVLYEMATGKKAFSGASRASLISSIMSSEPAPISSVQPMTPPALDRIVRTCLAKDPDDRWQSAHDVKSELAWIAEAGSQAGAPAVVASRRRSRERTAWLVAGAAVLAAAAGWYRVASAPKETRRPVRLALVRPPNAAFDFPSSLTASPDGSRIAFVGHRKDDRQSLWVRSIGALEPRELPGTDGARMPFWSPDGRFVGFFADGKLKKIDASGGPPETLADAPAPSGGSWGSRDTIVFVPHDFDGLFRVSSHGGPVERITSITPAEEAHRWPVVLPDGDHIVFLVDANQTDGHWMALTSLSSRKITHLAHAISTIAFAPPDRVLYVKSGSLVTQRIDLAGAKIAGDPEPVGENVLQIGDNHRFDFSVSASGLLLYQSADPTSQFFWLDRSGRRLQSVGAPGRYGAFGISPDGTRAAYEKLDADGRNENVWTLDLARGIASRVTSGTAADFSPVWMPDGRTIVFSSLRSGVNGDIYSTSSSGGVEDRKIFPGGAAGASASTVSPDGKILVYGTRAAGTRDDLWALPLGGGKPTPLRTTRFAETAAQFSRDGKWLAFVADDTGRDEVYVRSAADPSVQIQVSTNGGERPRWRRDGKEIYFLSGPSVMAAALSGGPDLRADPPRPLFTLSGTFGDYDVSPDGQRFLVTVPPHESVEPVAVAVLDWTEGLRKP